VKKVLNKYKFAPKLSDIMKKAFSIADWCYYVNGGAEK
jgi:hypothetical protein